MKYNIKMKLILAIITGYLIGSIPFSFLIAKFFGKKDIRKVGTKNVGGANVGREVGFIFGVIATLLDMSKGALSAFLIQKAGLVSPYDLVSAFFAIIGHCYSLFLNFEGGRGMATSIGAMAFFSFKETALSFIIFSPLFFFKEVALATLLSFAGLPVLIYLIRKDTALLVFSSAILLFLILRRLYFLKQDIKEKRPFLKTLLNRFLFDAPEKIKLK